MSGARLLLEVVDGTTPPAELPRSGVLTVGSSRERADFLVEGQGVAGVHCAIGRTKGGGWAVKDLGSEHGTRVNGEVVQAVRIGAGDELLLGSRRLRVVDARTAQEPRAQAAEAPPAAASGAPVASGGNGDGSPASVKAPRIDGYRIVRPLGRGGMGDVYLGVQESLAREVALKVLSHKVEADSAFVRRFQAEARAAAALNHPNIVTVYDVGETDGVHYLSMEYMDAGNLETRMARSGALDGAEAVRVLLDAASGLVYAESKGIVHRDIKPANLMQNRSGTTKIADLGLATHVDAEEAPEGKKVFGTPHFMSPEQARGERLDGRSDLYSLGATAYRLLSGRTPFEGQSSREILRAHLRDEPTPLSEVVPGVAPELAAVVAKLMRKAADERYASASELVRELERLARGASHAAAPASAARPRSRAALVLVPLVLVAVGAGVWWLVRGDAGTTSAEARGPGGRRLAGAPSDPADDPTGAPPLPAAGSSAGGPPATDPSGADRPPGDTDTQLKLREAEAKLAFLELDARVLEPAERSSALRELAAEYRGTTAASEALARADRLAEEARTATNRALVTTELAATLIAALRKAADGPAGRSTVDTFDALDAVLAAAPSDAAATSTPEFVAQRRAIEQGVIDAALARAEGTLDALERGCTEGSFDGVTTALDALAPTFVLPTGVEERGLAGLGRLDALKTRAAELRASLPERRVAYAERMAETDARTIAGAVRDGGPLLGGPSGAGAQGGKGVIDRIAALDLAAAAERLRQTAASLHGAEARELTTALADDVARAEGVLRTLANEFAGAGWRRTKVTDPRERGRTAREAVGADASGLLLDVDGDVQKLSWSSYGCDTKELHRLFNDRLARSWTQPERDAIAALMRLTAVAETLRIALPMMVPGERRSVLQRELAQVDEAFANARLWSDGEEARRLDREREATTRLFAVIERTFAERWSEAASGTQHLLSSYRDTLLVRALSDGTDSAGRTAQPFVELPRRATEETGSERDESADSSTGPGKDEAEHDERDADGDVGDGEETRR